MLSCVGLNRLIKCRLGCGSNEFPLLLQDNEYNSLVKQPPHKTKDKTIGDVKN